MEFYLFYVVKMALFSASFINQLTFRIHRYKYISSITLFWGTLYNIIY